MATPPRPTFQVPQIPNLPSPSGSRPRTSISSSFTFDPSHLVNSIQQARSGNKHKDSFALDPNRSVLPVSPLRSSPRRPRRGHRKTASIQNTTHPLANDSTADVFLANETEYDDDQEEEEDIEWGMVDRMRLWRHDAMMQHLYETAAFWGDKILSWTGDKNDAFWLAQVYFMTNQYSRAERLLTRPFSISTDIEENEGKLINGHILPHPTTFSSLPGPSLPGGSEGRGDVIDKGKGKETFTSVPSTGSFGPLGPSFDIGNDTSRVGRLPMGLNAPDMVAEQLDGVVKLVDVSVACRYLAAQCQVRQGKWAEAMEMLGESNPFRENTQSGPQIPNVDGGIKIEASMCHLRGLLMLKLSRGDTAKECFMEALALDVKCYDAFDQLVSGEMMTTEEEWEFVQGLAFKEQTPEDADFIRLIYTARLRKYKHAEEHALTRRRLTEEFGLTDNPDVLFSFADALFTQFRWKECYAITSRILSLVSIHAPTMPLHVACMHHLPHLRSKLFILAHELVEKEPEAAMSWYAVGVWYLTSKKWGEARTYFSKTSLMDPRFSPAWVAFAHTFALEGEHDHAITAYSTCARLFAGSHLPLMFVGMEHITLSNFDMADEALNAANAMCDSDPLLHNERGVMAYNRGDYKSAVDLFRRALQIAEDTQGLHVTWATTFLNLGSAFAKIGHFEGARASYKRVLEMEPRNATAFALLGKILIQMSDWDAAIVKFHESLSIDPINPHVIELLNIVLHVSSMMGMGQQGRLPIADDVWAAGMRREQDRAKAVAQAKVRDNGPNWRDEEMNVE